MTMQHDHHGEIEFTQDYWDNRYLTADRLWSGRPNVQLVAQAADLQPGDALDVGCGEGADAIWLAGQGWHVTAVDVSAVALDRAARHAAAQGSELAARITWQQADLLSWDPAAAQFDLVSAQFMYLPHPAFEDMCARLAAAVRPRGTLLMVGHHPDEVRARGAAVADMAWSAEQLAAALDGSFEIVVAAAIERPATDADGQPIAMRDTVLRACRRL
ncbi:MAG TPA: methyltransferase domain-containing protein [Streptosporangiaceae bacterium]|nr:methyltransferase domain-containing protein [Streptosporangiaceae bacterium]